MKKNIFCTFIVVLFFSCQSRYYNHITYLNQVNEIDSIYRFKNDTLTVIKMYQKLFKKYSPNNSYLIDEYQTYIVLADKFNKDFGGKKSLKKLIPLFAPYWKYTKQDKNIIQLYKRYNIDSTKLELEINNWKKGLNKRLVDSFSVAIYRDQEKGRHDSVGFPKNSTI